MLINFDEIEETRIPEFNHGTGITAARMYVDEGIRIMKGCLLPDSSIGLHTHHGSSETVFILSGNGKMICDRKDEPLFEGSCTYCPDGHEHSLVNTGTEPLVFYAVVPQLCK